MRSQAPVEGSWKRGWQDGVYVPVCVLKDACLCTHVSTPVWRSGAISDGTGALVNMYTHGLVAGRNGYKAQGSPASPMPPSRQASPWGSAKGERTRIGRGQVALTGLL